MKNSSVSSSFSNLKTISSLCLLYSWHHPHIVFFNHHCPNYFLSASYPQQLVTSKTMYFRHFVALRKFFYGRQMGHCPDNAIKNKNYLLNNCYWDIPHSLNGDQMVFVRRQYIGRNIDPSVAIWYKKQTKTTSTYFFVSNWLFVIARVMLVLRRPPLGKHYATKQNHTPEYLSATYSLELKSQQNQICCTLVVME